MWRELEHAYPNELPVLHLETMNESTLRESKPEALLRANRQGKVPTFVGADGTVLFESAAICNYFCRLFDHKHKLLPQDPVAMARHDMVTHYVCGTADNVLATSSPVQRVLEDKRPGLRPEVLQVNKRAWYELVAPTLQEFIESRPKGVEFSATDVIFGFTLFICSKKFPDWLDDHPVLKAFYVDVVSKRPAFIDAMQ
jgi:glutathione S-transferase